MTDGVYCHFAQHVTVTLVFELQSFQIIIGIGIK